MLEKNFGICISSVIAAYLIRTLKKEFDVLASMNINWQCIVGFYHRTVKLGCQRLQSCLRVCHNCASDVAMNGVTYGKTKNVNPYDIISCLNFNLLINFVLNLAQYPNAVAHDLPNFLAKKKLVCVMK